RRDRRGGPAGDRPSMISLRLVCRVGLASLGQIAACSAGSGREVPINHGSEAAGAGGDGGSVPDDSSNGEAQDAEADGTAGTTEDGEASSGPDDADGRDAPDEPNPCTPGDTRPCYDGPLDTRKVGACKDGTSKCNPSGLWSGFCI